MDFLNQLALGSGMLALPLLLFGIPGLRSVWRCGWIAVMAVLVASILLLRIDHLWWPPAPCLSIIGTVLIAHILYVLRRRIRHRQI
jgi:hypothetical protein